MVTKSFSDHEDFSPAELEALDQRGDNLIMTEKDAVKCAHIAKENWWYLPVTATLAAPDAERIIHKIQEVMEHYGSSTT